MIESVVNYFMALQTTICTALETLDGKAVFSLERFIPPNGRLSQPRVLAERRSHREGRRTVYPFQGERIAPSGNRA